MAVDQLRAAQAVRELLLSLGADPDSPELRETPERVADYWRERLDGYCVNPLDYLQPLPGELEPCPVILERIPFVSTCEHHLAPFEGHATIGYIPSPGRVVGLSRLARLVQAYAHRLQVQERMVHEIAQAMEKVLRPAAWGIKLEAVHTCMAHRGVKIPDVPVVTTLLGGAWKENPPKAFE